MDKFIKLLDKNLEYVNHQIIDNTFYTNVISNRKQVICPFCGTPSTKVHSRYVKQFQDLPIQGNKVILKLTNRKMFCVNDACSHKTFAENFDFLMPKAKKTKRLENEILNLSLNLSSINAAKYLSEKVAKVSKSTICNLLKKKK
ncbi:transposase family protein [Clostridium cochlearium]|uniref:transposase family protein n=1 Tax=Clostridium cochlearium TaxID=1494 RepID=UPI001459E144|nr:transposase family protein [Clostridium cochlearium]NME96474.1 transposase family protein [Clostridium cochlearium]